MSRKVEISVVIRARNEDRWIGHCIQSVLDNIESPEIIVIDNMSTDETIPIVKTFQHDPTLSDSKGYTSTKVFKLRITHQKALTWGFLMLQENMF